MITWSALHTCDKNGSRFKGFPLWMVTVPLLGIIITMSAIAVPSDAYAKDFAEDFESYSTGTLVPDGWTYEYVIKQPKTPEIEIHKITSLSQN